MEDWLSTIPWWGWASVTGFVFLVAVILFYLLTRKDTQTDSFDLKAFRKTCDASEDRILIVDRSYRVLYANHAANKLHPFKTFDSLETGLDVFRFYDQSTDEWNDLKQLIHSHRWRKVDEPTFFYNLRLGENLAGPFHVKIYSVSRGEKNHRDIVILKDASCEQRLLDLQQINGLSGLPNRFKAYKEITALISRIPTSQRFALLTMELDNPSQIRSLLGYEEMETIIAHISNALRELANNPKIHCYHLNYVTFLLVIENPTDDTIHTMIQNFQTLLEQNYSQAQGKHNLSFSYGVAFYPDYNTLPNLLNGSYKALSEAQELGEGRVIFARDNMSAQSDHTLLLHHEIERGLANREFRLFFQPLVKSSDLSLGGAEVLIRWFDPERGLRPPDTFIPFAEKSGLIDKIGYYVLEGSLKMLNHWYRAGFPSIQLNVNISLRELENPEFMEKLDQFLHKYDIGSSRIKFEITEHATMLNPVLVRERLEKINQLGIAVALDDFGTGYSSFAHLAELPIDTLKIDKSFVSGMLHERNKEHIVSSITKLGHSLGMTIVAEGIEKEEEAKLLKEYGVDLFQGYYFSKPLPQLEFQYLLSHPELGVKG